MNIYKKALQMYNEKENIPFRFSNLISYFVDCKDLHFINKIKYIIK